MDLTESVQLSVNCSAVTYTNKENEEDFVLEMSNQPEITHPKSPEASKRFASKWLGERPGISAGLDSFRKKAENSLPRGTL